MKQISFPIKKRGGRRTGAGRKNRVGEGAHGKRPAMKANFPLHITIRLRDGLPNLRQRRVFSQIKRFIKKAREFGLNVNEFAVLKNHIHMIAEVESSEALKSGMKSFNGRLGRFLRRYGKIKTVHYPRGLFKGRYHINMIKSSRQMRNTLKYVLLNAARHFHKIAYIDSFSSGAGFTHWRELLQEKFDSLIMAQVLDLEERQGGKLLKIPELVPPKSWLATQGWRRAVKWA